MEWPTRKQRKVLLIIGVTGAVYVSLQYFLPLVIPFLVAYLIALGLRPWSVWLEKRLKVQIKGREIHMPLGVIGGVLMLLVLVLFGMAVYWGGRRLTLEAHLFLENFPSLVRSLDVWLTEGCFWLERVFRLETGCVVSLLQEMLHDLVQMVKESTMPFLVLNTMAVLKGMVQVTVITVIMFVASILSLQEMESLKRRREQSAFHKEFALLSSRLLSVGNAYLKTQAGIILLTMVICTLGLFLIKNPYYIILGIGIGLLDALPIFGTGTILVPWAVFQFASGNWIQGCVLVGIYIICYFLREILEAKMMGDKVGLTPLETLISMYVGLKLFGLLGFILGPVGLLIIEDLVDLYGSSY